MIRDPAPGTSTAPAAMKFPAARRSVQIVDRGPGEADLAEWPRITVTGSAAALASQITGLRDEMHRRATATTAHRHDPADPAEENMR